MSWKEVSSVSLRKEFVALTSNEGANVRELCRRFRISPRTAYKWLVRYSQDGIRGLEEKSRRPISSHQSHQPGNKRHYPFGPPGESSLVWT
jgi:transposase-like protein